MQLSLKRNLCTLTTSEIKKLNIRLKSVAEEITMQSNVWVFDDFFATKRTNLIFRSVSEKGVGIHVGRNCDRNRYNLRFERFRCNTGQSRFIGIGRCRRASCSIPKLWWFIFIWTDKRSWRLCVPNIQRRNSHCRCSSSVLGKKCSQQNGRAQQYRTLFFAFLGSVYNNSFNSMPMISDCDARLQFLHNNGTEYEWQNGLFENGCHSANYGSGIYNSLNET